MHRCHPAKSLADAGDIFTDHAAIAEQATFQWFTGNQSARLLWRRSSVFLAPVEPDNRPVSRTEIVRLD